MRTGAVDRYERVATFDSDEAAAWRYAIVRQRLLSYDVFEPRVVRARMCTPGVLTGGATIVQRMGARAVSLESGVRVVRVWDEAGEEPRCGFAYVTLSGHPERGVARFDAMRSGRTVRVDLHARSVAGSWITLAARPVARGIQRSLTARAADRLVRS
jgi:uncharacterized protein (UPF0548 family)